MKLPLIIASVLTWTAVAVAMICYAGLVGPVSPLF